MKHIIHVNQHNIKYNNKNKDKKKVITVKNYKETKYCDKVKILGPSTVVYSPNPLSCGARCWVETDSEIELE